MITEKLKLLPLMLMLLVGLTGCLSDDSESSFGSGENQPPAPPPTMGSDDARRAVLADIGEDIILPALRDFDTQAELLRLSVNAHAAAPQDIDARVAAQDAWRAAMQSWQRNEVLQVGPAGRSTGLDTTPGGDNLRGLIYSFPFFTACAVDNAALNDTPVNENTSVNIRGLGAIEYLLFQQGPNSNCPPPAGANLIDQRADYAAALARFIATVASDLTQRWEPSGGNFLAKWSNAGLDGSVYSRPQDALDALSVGLFYTEKDTKDDKIADPTGIGATGLTPCPTVSCPERLESRISMTSGDNIRINVQAFRDVFSGIDGGMGVNDLLRGIGRDDLADEILAELDATLVQLDALPTNFDTAVENIASANACTNASANLTGEPACALHGFITAAMNTFRGPIVAALSLATPNRAAGDND